MMTKALAILLAILAGLNASPSMCAESDAPTMVAFVVGLESYQDTGLNQLQYPAQDARDVFEQLKAVGNLQKNRSWLLLAERKAREQEERSDETRIIRRRYWPAHAIRNEFKAFLETVTDGDLVVIYVGGHGFAAKDQSLLLTASDFDPIRKYNDIPYSDLIGDIKREIAGRNLGSVQVAMFLNVCGAGNAGAQNITPDMLDAARKLQAEHKFGNFRSVLFPATAPQQDAFEDYEKRKRSVFAHYLIEGLRGGAADKQTGAIMAGPLLDHIEKGLNEFRKERGQTPVKLPPIVDQQLVLGVTKRQQGEANYLAAMALLAASREIAPASAAELDRDERQAQSGLLIDLAVDQLTQALRRNPELKARARLRRAQANLANGVPANAEEVQRDLRAVTEAESSQMLSESEQAEAKALAKQAAPSQLSPQTLRELRDQLQAGAPFHALLITESVRTTAREPQEQQAASWARLLSGYPGLRRAPLIASIDVDFNRLDFDRGGLTKESLDAIGLASSTADPQARLVVVYAGRSSTSARASTLRGDKPSFGQTLASTDAAALPDRLFPFGRAEIEQIAEAWKGPITVIVDAPFGGTLLRGKPVEKANISLFLAAREPNGMTFYSPAGKQSSDPSAELRSTTDVLISAFQRGVEDLAQDPEILAAQAGWKREFGQQTFDWVIGTPVWIPGWGHAAEPSVVNEQLGLLAGWANLVAQGCAHEALASCDRSVTDRVQASDPMRLLQSAASAEMSGGSAEVIRLYRKVESDLTQLANAPASTAFGAAAAGLALQDAAAIVRARAVGAESKGARRIHVISFGVEDYHSPLIADLSGTFADLQAYETALSGALAADATQIVFNQNRTATTAREVLDALNTVRAQVEGRPQDLVILIFSGRGIELAGRRYLATAAADHLLASGRSGAAGTAEQRALIWSTSELIDLWQIAQIMSGRWFIGLYDTQFVHPVREDRPDQLLDKHLDSVRPREAPELGDRNQRKLVNVARATEMLRRAEVPRRQVHIWLEGKVTPSSTPPHPCAAGLDSPPNTVSPLATAIVSKLRTEVSDTYRNLLKTLGSHPCLRSQENELGLSVQGDIDVPVFESGEGAEFVEFFRSGDARRELNLQAALGVSGAAMARFPTARHQLSRAALLVSLIQLLNGKEEILGKAEQQGKRFREALGLLDGLSLAALTAEDAEDLWPIRLELLVRLHELGKPDESGKLRSDPAEAVRVLHEAQPVTLLAKRDLARRLVDATREAINQQSTVVLKKTEETLSALRKENEASVVGADNKLDQLRRAERERRAQSFSLVPPRSQASERSP
jgi:hypothetical protein